MSALLVMVAAVYGSSLLVVTGGGILWKFSPRFRRELVDHKGSI